MRGGGCERKAKGERNDGRPFLSPVYKVVYPVLTNQSNCVTLSLVLLLPRAPTKTKPIFTLLWSEGFMYDFESRELLQGRSCDSSFFICQRGTLQVNRKAAAFAFGAALSPLPTGREKRISVAELQHRICSGGFIFLRQPLKLRRHINDVGGVRQRQLRAFRYQGERGALVHISLVSLHTRSAAPMCSM